MRLNEAPRVTAMIPLYRSAKFLDVIRGNLKRLTWPNLEILISDRHLYDDALDTLEREFGHDSRIRFLRADDRIGWVEHFNLLMREATGDFFFWMPHDDDFPEDYVPKLVAALRCNSEAILAFGGIEPITRTGRTRSNIQIIAPGENWGDAWSRRLHLRMTTHSNPGIGFRGLFRRQPLIERALFMRDLRGSVLADYYWVFATGLLGSWVYVPDCTCRKRYYQKSTHRRWKFSNHTWFDGLSILQGYIRDFAPGPRDAIYARTVILLWLMINLLNHRAKQGRLAGRVAGIARRPLEFLLNALVRENADAPLLPIHLLGW